MAAAECFLLTFLKLVHYIVLSGDRGRGRGEITSVRSEIVLRPNHKNGDPHRCKSPPSVIQIIIKISKRFAQGGRCDLPIVYVA